MFDALITPSHDGEFSTIRHGSAVETLFFPDMDGEPVPVGRSITTEPVPIVAVRHIAAYIQA